MRKNEILEKLKHKMKIICDKCERGQSGDTEYCMEKCPIHFFTNYMLAEVNGD